jgi:hypothetical protein
LDKKEAVWGPIQNQHVECNRLLEWSGRRHELNVDICVWGRRRKKSQCTGVLRGRALGGEISQENPEYQEHHGKNDKCYQSAHQAFPTSRTLLASFSVCVSGLTCVR